MLVHSPTANVLIVLLFLLAGTLDLYLFIAMLRLILGRVPAVRAAPAFSLLREFADPAPRYVDHWLARRWQCPTPGWVSWGAVLTGVLIARQLVVGLLLILQ